MTSFAQRLDQFVDPRPKTAAPAAPQPIYTAGMEPKNAPRANGIASAASSGACCTRAPMLATDDPSSATFSDALLANARCDFILF